MKKTILLLIIFSNTLFAQTSSWQFKDDVYYQGSKIRTGIKKHIDSEYMGTIMYLEGLGDSMLNHAPLFNHLNENGYDVIAFDYRGQGGSEGKMNSTRIHNINELSEIVWSKFESSSKKKILLGWSTGGLAAYRYAHKYPGQTKAIILMAPGIAPKKFVGETNLLSCFSAIGILLKSCKVLAITERSLTQENYKRKINPHLERIKPDSPLDFCKSLTHSKE